MSTFLPLFDWTMTERVAKATGFNPDTSPEASNPLREMKSHWQESPAIPQDLMMKGYTFLALVGWVDAKFNDRGIPMPKWIADWLEQALAVMAGERLFVELDPETVNRVIEDFGKDEVQRILAAGYPLARYRPTEGEDGEWLLDWWAEDLTEIHLSNEYIYALCNLSDEEADRAFKRMMAHQDSIAERTIDAVRREKNLNDLCSLIDAAANQDGARIAQSAAGQFLRRIAELAMSAINTTGDQRND